MIRFGLPTRRRGSRADLGVEDRRRKAQEVLPACLGRDTYYHVTSLDVMISICRRGLVPGKVKANFPHLAQHSQGRLFLAAGEAAGVGWWEMILANGQPNPVLLRVERTAVRDPEFDSKGNSDVECSVFVTHSIPASALCFWNPKIDEYNSLSKWKAPNLDEEGGLTRAESFCPDRALGDDDYDEYAEEDSE